MRNRLLGLLAVLAVTASGLGSQVPAATVWHEGCLISCDVGIHPGWKRHESPHTGYIFSIDIA